MTDNEKLMASIDGASHALKQVIDGTDPDGIRAVVHTLGQARYYAERLNVTEPEYDPAYVGLARVLADAFNQSAGGKGKDRHVKAEGQAFEDQPICQLQQMYGRGYAFGQVGKKMEESMRLPYEQARAELLGGIVYLAAAVIDLEKEDERATRQQTMGSD